MAGLAISLADPGGPIEMVTAAKDDGFMGFGAHQVSQGEQATLYQVSSVVTR